MIDKTEMPIEEAVETLTGYEEQTIEQRFGADIGDLLELKPMTGMRAMASVLIARDLACQDVKDPKGKAYARVMEMTMKQIAGFFPDDEAEVDPEQPVTPSGEGDVSAD